MAKSNETFRSGFAPKQSLSATITSGLFVTGVLFTLLSVISLFGFIGFQKTLNSLADEKFPTATDEARLSVLLNQLLDQTEQLQHAQSEKERQLTSENIIKQFRRLEGFSTNATPSPKNLPLPLVRLNETLQGANSLLSDLFAKQELLDRLNASLLELNGRIIELLQELRRQPPPTPEIDACRDILLTCLLLINEQVSASHNREDPAPIQSMPHITTFVAKSRLRLAEMDNDLRKILLPIVDQFAATVMGENGLLQTNIAYQNLRQEKDSQFAIIKSLIGAKGDESITKFFDLSEIVIRENAALSGNVNKLIKIISLLFFLSLLFAVISFFYFRRALIHRLIKLNNTVLTMIHGENRVTDVTGNDEISDIAKSINYFSSELRKAKELAEKSAIVKTDFLAQMSHEIRTPMNAILGFSDLAICSSNPTDHLNYLGKINGACRSLLGIINSILDFSKIEAGKFPIEDEPFDLRELLAELSAIISLNSEESGLDFYFSIEPKTVFALIGDALRLKQILTNLIANAYKFTDQGYILLHIESHRENADESNSITLQFSVQDTGPGISAEQRETLFQPFTQADKSITRRFGGTGLGLAITRSLVELMGGTIRVDSPEQGGTIFSFSLPLRTQPGKSDHHFYLHPPALDGKKALVVSEKPHAATELSWTLNNFSLQVVQALSMDEAIAQIKAQDLESPYDFLLIDSGTNSFAILDNLVTLRSINKNKNHPAIILIGPARLSPHYHKQQLHELELFLEQPITPEKLLQAMLDLLHLANPYQRQEKPSAVSFNDLHANTKRSGRILLVEDNEINQEIVVRYLNMIGLGVTVANNGAEALQLLQENSPSTFHLVLMDIQMPVMDGYTATEAIRTLPPPLCDIPIVALTAHAMEQEHQRSRQAGMNDYITKPIDPRRFHEIFDRLLPQASRQQANPGHAAAPSLPKDAIMNDLGIDMEAGLNQVMNDSQLYVKLLRTFVENYRNYPSLIQMELKQFSLPAVKQMVHTLKGVCGSLRMKKLHQLCFSLEDAVKAKQLTEAGRLLGELDKEVKKVCNALDQWLERYGTFVWKNIAEQPDHGPGMSDDSKQQLLVRLVHSLHQNNARALQEIRQLSLLASKDESELLAIVEAHINNLDFAKARLLLEDWQDTPSARAERFHHA
jgi:two-component system sensor histidine kinase/response regulator